MLCFVGTALVAYLIGSLPTGYIAGRIRGIDVRKVGRGNVRATNVSRVLGKRFGYGVFLVDFLKGLGPVLLARAIAPHCQLDSMTTDLCVALAGMFSVIGHSFPVWLGFKGGKGV